ncbi:MAG TPA: hypothetical protein VFF27_12855 [Bacteroidia bacterium]|jgi:hypothetical protein|nr:hypothetical protein [Bacteroidia bacterium]
MKYEFTLDEQDYLENCLFLASNSKIYKKRKLASRLILPILYIGLGLYMLSENDVVFATIFLAFSFLWFLFSPALTRNRYKKFYRKTITESYSKRLGRISTFEIESTDFLMTEEKNVSRISLKDLESVNELAKYFILKLQIGSTIILPKDKINNLSELKKELKDLAQVQNVPFNEELNWKFR